MAPKSRKISTLVESQLPEFISSEYRQFSLVLEKYYEQLELQGQPLDIIHNVTNYRDINQYENNLLNQYTKLYSNIDTDDTTILIEDGSSFPEKNGYIKIGNEICFYKERVSPSNGNAYWQFKEVSRGVSGNTTLGDLYESSTFVTTEAESHYTGDLVYNVSNLFLYALIKNFEAEYLDPFPEKYLKKEVNKRTLIKNIKKFYKAKGTDRSIKFIFNSIVSQDITNVPEVYNPKDYTLKASTSDWITNYSLKVRLLSGDAKNLIGQQITQTAPTFASAIVDNVVYLGKYAGEEIYELVLEASTVVSNFDINAKTTLSKALNASAAEGSRINVVSTFGWKTKGALLIGNERITFNEKNVNQFVIESRLGTVSTHAVGTPVYDFLPIQSNNVSFLVLGVLYNLNVKSGAPYSNTGDRVEVSDPGFDTRDPIIYDVLKNNYRWLVNENNTSPSIPNNVALQATISDLNANVSAIYEDEQYYYICSSGYPSHQILTASTNATLKDQKFLRLIRKYPTTVTEIYPTTSRDTGIFVDGTVAMSYKDSDFVNFGKITKINVTNKGTGYKATPYVLVNDLPQKAEAHLSGEVVESISVITSDNFSTVPQITVTSGRNAVVNAIVTKGRVTSLVIANPGEYYSSAPIIRITDNAGRGKFAEYKAIVSFNGRIVDFEKIDEGKFYTQNNIVVEVIPEGSGATAKAEIVRWVKNRYEKIKNNLDDSNGYVFENIDQNKQYGYGRVANPVRLRYSLDDNLTNTFNDTVTKKHSPILGFAYDGNPIYGPYGYQDPTDPDSAIVKLQSGYSLKGSRENGPSVAQYPLGTFIDDYGWVPSIQTGKTVLDRNNGRFCVTPEYPKGTYAYFVTVDNTNQPAFPYIVGENYYSLPVDSNYNSLISQDDLPSNVKRLRSENLTRNGDGVVALIDDVTTGSINSIVVEDTPKSFNVGNKLVFDNSGTNGSGASAFVSEVSGEDVTSIKSKGTIVKLDIIENAYLFENDYIRQETTNAVGKIVGNVFNDKTVLLEEVVGTFNLTNKVSARNLANTPVNVVNLILDQNCSYTKDAIISLTDGLNQPTSVLATGQILESTTNQNSVKLKVLTGQFVINTTHFLRSSDLNNTPGARIFSISSLSQNLTPFSLSTNVALAVTNSPHNLAIGDKINIDINPDDNLTETLYYVRKRAYQEVVLLPFEFNTTLDDSGIGRFNILNSGANYDSGTYQNVELVFLNPDISRKDLGREGNENNAKATVVVTAGKISSVTITNKGKTYTKGDVLTIVDNRLFNQGSTKQAIIFVDHAGLSATETKVKLFTINELSQNDTIKIGNEVIKIVSIDAVTKTLTVLRAQENTLAADHFDTQKVSIYNGTYRFNQDYYPLANGQNDPSVFSYDGINNKLVLKYAYNSTNPNGIVLSNVFYDNSTPRKLVAISSVSDVIKKLEFSKGNQSNFVINPVIDVQKYYSYKFNTSHFSMANTFLDFSPSLNENIFVEEKTVGVATPGTANAFVKIKLGFGALIKSNSLNVKSDLRFNNYYYFIVANDVDTDNSSLRVIDDSLTGKKSIIYVTSNKFVYTIDSEPQYQGSGDISYTTDSKFALGKIVNVTVDNSGNLYNNIPSVEGVYVSPTKEAKLKTIYDAISKKITSVEVLSGGYGYINPKIAISNSFDYGARFKVYQENGQIKRVDILNSGMGFEYLPELKVIEGGVKIYATSNDIGVPKNVRFVNNGGGFFKDNSVLSSYRSAYTLLITNFNDYDFYQGETVVQQRLINGVFVETASGKIAKNGIRPGSNLLKVEGIKGEFDKSLPIIGKSNNKTANIKAILYTEFSPDIKSYYDNVGYYKSDKGKLSSNTQKLTDSYFYQDYSYVIKSKTAISVWRDLIKQTTHPAGFKLFGEVIVESEGKNSIPEVQKSPQRVSIINLAPKSVAFVSTKQNITETILNVTNSNVERGIGNVSLDSFNNSETLSTLIKLDSDFNGDYDPNTGQIVGKTTFTVIDKKTNTPLQVYNEQQLLITLDGVLQEPGVAYTVQNNQITFATAPLGQRTIEGQVVPAQDFFGKSIRFKNNTLNNRYLKKVRNIFQRNGIWLDSANQIRFNSNFIIEETIGYAKDKYPSVNWIRSEQVYKAAINQTLIAIEHDLRFGGNIKVINYAESFFAGNGINIDPEDFDKLIDVIDYTITLCIAAVRNWDVTFINDGLNNPVTITSGSNIVTVPSTAGIAVGMFISSGKQFPENTKVAQILSATQVELTNPAFVDIGNVFPPLAVNETSTYTVPGGADQVFGTILVEGTLQVSLNSVISSRASISSVSQITFYFSKINTGTFYDAAELIENNKLYIQEETIGKIEAEYPLLQISDESKCIRDLGYYIDAVVYHLKYGGNAKIVEFGQTYYEGNRLQYINNKLTETVRAFEYATELMVHAMRNELGVGVYTNEDPFTDSTILPDIDLPACQEVESALNSYYDAVDTILTVGKNLVITTPENSQKSGNWTTVKTYSNYSLLPDAPIFNTECQEVVSSLLTIFDSIEDTLIGGPNSVAKSLPDYFDGENTTYDLYYEDGSIVKTDENENLFVSLNGVIQKVATESNENAYYILRSSDLTEPDKIVFSTAPKWDQDDSAILLQEATAVEKFFAFSVGNYESYTINNSLIEYLGSGPYIIVSDTDNKIKSVDDPNYALVFIDGVLQKQNEAYSINGSSIVFTEPLNYYITESNEKIYPTVDIVVLYGRDLDKIATFYDFEPDLYYNKIEIRIDGSNTFQQFKNFYNNAYTKNYDQIAYQIINGKVKIIGKIRGYENDNFRWKLILSGNNPDFDNTQSLYLGIANDTLNPQYTIEISNDLIVNSGQTFTVPANEEFYYGVITVQDTGLLVVEGTISSSNFELSFARDDEGNRIVRRDTTTWLYQTDRGDRAWKTTSNLYANLAEGDLIQIDGENDYRRIIKLPDVVKSKQFNPSEKVSNNMYGKVSLTNYEGITRGEGLNITATITNGSITKLNWNRRDLNLYFNKNVLLQPTAYQYFIPPVIEFIPTTENGGGARAEVIAIGGQIVDIVLLDGGSGYTEPPKVIVSRGYNRIKHFGRKIDSVSSINVQPKVLDSYSSLVTSTTINLESTLKDIASITSTLVAAASDVSRIKTILLFIVTPDTSASYEATDISNIILPAVNVVSISSSTNSIVQTIETKHNVITSTTIKDVTKEIVVTPKIIITDAILKNPLPTVSDLGAFLDIGLSATDNIVYIPNTVNFPDTGRLLIGKEIVFYTNKLSDRFLNVLRGQYNTIATPHNAGDYLRLIPDTISVIEAPVQQIYSISSVTLGNNLSTEIFRTTATSFVDVEAFVTESNVEIEVDSETGFIDGQSVNEEKYTYFTLGTTITGYEETAFIDVGVAKVSGDYIENLNVTYTDMSIQDFDKNYGTYYKNSSKFISTTPSINEYGSFLNGNIDNVISTIVVTNTGGFPSSGYLLIGKEVISYAGKTLTSFTGVVRAQRGTQALSHLSGQYIRSLI